MRVLLCASVITLAFTNISIADAANIVEVVNYTADNPSLFIGSVVRGPGRYRFQFDTTTPLVYLEGSASKTRNYNFYCDFGEGDGVFPCGGDDNPDSTSFARVSPLRYTADVTVIEPYSVPESGFPFVRTDYYDTCCDYVIDFQGVRAGTATLSITALPEPRSWMLLIAGFGTVGAMMRAQRSRARLAVSYS